MIRLSSRTFRAPTADDVFFAWVDRLKSQEIDKYFAPKGAKIRKDQISSAENVYKVEKRVVGLIFVRVKYAGKPEEKIIKPKMLSKTTFYDMETPTPVPVFRSISKVVCNDCGGTGTTNCKTCRGTGKVECERCKGTGKVKCKRCDGSGKIVIKVNVVTREKKVIKKDVIVTCPECHGSGKVICPDCHGFCYVVCPDCGGTGKIVCRNCDGHGHLIKYKVSPIGGVERTLRFIAPREMVKSKEMESIIKELKNVDCLDIRDVAELEEERFISSLGFIPENMKEFIMDIRSILSEVKSKFKKAKIAIKVYPLIKVYVKTIRKKRAVLIGFGSMDNFKVVRLE